MSDSVDPLWHEIWALQHRVDVLDTMLTQTRTQLDSQSAQAQSSVSGRRYALSTTVAVVSTVAFVLSLLTQLGVQL